MSDEQNASNDRCVKCGWCGRIYGPRYSANYPNDSGYSIGERLVYRCIRCGYEWTQPVRDADSVRNQPAPRSGT